MNNPQTSKFSAASSLSGYLYQCRYALLEALRKIRQQVDFTVSLETLDDVVFEIGDNVVELLQTKHRIGQNANISDASPDLWKSIRIWCASRNTETNVDTYYFLITTATAAENSIAHLLKPGSSRSVPMAVTCLNEVALSSTNTENAPAYEALRSLTEASKAALFEKVYIFDASPYLPNLDGEIRQELFFAVENKFLDGFMSRFEGWWFRRVINQISGEVKSSILAEEITAELSHIREQYKTESLPIDDDILYAVVNDVDFLDRQFVQQLRLIDVPDRRILIAIRDYFRAFTQRSRWIREDLLYVGELKRYEKRLIEEWEIHFEGMREELGHEATEAEKIKAAKELYKWIERGNLLQIRSGVSEPCIPRGSYHMLSDDSKLGWHIEFAERLKKLLETPAYG
jgi:hypothetical protein